MKLFNLYSLLTTFINGLNACSIEKPECNYEYVCPKITEITDCGEGGVDGFTTYQLSLTIKPNKQIKNIYAIYGDPTSEMYWPPAYNIGGPFDSDIGGISPTFFSIIPNAKYDSWTTIGITDGDQHNELSTIGIDFSEWNEENSVTTSNGAVFLMDPTIILHHDEYVIAQLTLPSDETHIMNVNVQGKLTTGIHAWTELNVEFRLNPIKNNIQPTISTQLPINCQIWYDGCNLCGVDNGVIIHCTEIECEEHGVPQCRYFDSGH